MDSRASLNALYKRKKSLNPTVNRITRFRPLSCKLDTLPTELNRLFEIYVKTENTHGVLPLSNDSLYEGYCWAVYRFNISHRIKSRELKSCEVFATKKRPSYCSCFHINTVFIMIANETVTVSSPSRPDQPTHCPSNGYPKLSSLEETATARSSFRAKLKNVWKFTFNVPSLLKEEVIRLCGFFAFVLWYFSEVTTS